MDANAESESTVKTRYKSERLQPGEVVFQTSIDESTGVQTCDVVERGPEIDERQLAINALTANITRRAMRNDPGTRFHSMRIAFGGMTLRVK